MNRFNGVLQWGRRAAFAGLLTMTLGGCGDGDDGDTGPAGPPGPAAPVSATSLDMQITGVTIQSSPVVEFNVANQDGAPFTGLTTADLRFTVAKLMPGSLGNPSSWQNYINREETAEVGPGTGNTALQATRENDGTLVDHGDGTYTYTFATDITNVTTPVANVYV